MSQKLRVAFHLLAVVLAGVIVTAQGTVSGIFFTEGWESGTATTSFNSQGFGQTTGSQFTVQGAVKASGAWALFHTLVVGAPVQYATQHFGDAPTGPVWASGRGQHFQDLYVQYKIYYAPGFDFNTEYKQLIIGTQDDRRHEDVCCNPWVANYIYTNVDPGGRLAVTVNNKQSPSGQWTGHSPNIGGYGSSNPLMIQAGRWYTIEVRMRLNDAGVDNGIFQMWVDGQQVGDYRSVRFRIPWNGTYGSNTSYGTNFAMISDFADAAGVRNQGIYYDDVKLSTTYIGGAGIGPLPPTNLRIIS